MFKKESIDLIYRLICLITFLFVILFVNSIITLTLLLLLFLLLTKKENDFTFLCFSFLSFIFFVIAFMTDNYFLFKLMIIIGYTYYFLVIPSLGSIIQNSVDKIVGNTKKIVQEEIENEGEVSETELIRFKNLGKKQVNKKGFDLNSTIYLTVHLGLLFISILVG